MVEFLNENNETIILLQITSLMSFSTGLSFISTEPVKTNR
jgi:hypothetical protein